MLILSRATGTSIWIGDEIHVQVLSIDQQGQIRFAIRLDESIAADRKDIDQYAKAKRDNRTRGTRDRKRRTNKP